MSTQSTDCLIIGAGPVGLTLACQLQQYGVDFRIVDQLEGPVIRTKAAAIWSRTAEFLEQMGLVEQFMESGLHCYGASFYADGKRVAHLTLDSIDSLYNYVMMVPQHTTERILRKSLESNNVDVEYGKRLVSLSQNSHKAAVELETGEIIVARWVVGCDGAHSGVRHALGLSFDGEKLESQWIVSDLFIEGLPLDDEILLFMHSEGPTALFPLGNDFYRLVAETQSTSDPTSEERAKIEVQRLLKVRVPGPGVSIQNISRAGFFSIHERQVRQYRVGQVFLAGDSAHVHSPLGGQGMNTGMQDANNLGWKLAMVSHGRMKEILLDTYHEERHPVGEWLVQATSRGTKMVTNRQPIVAAVRKQAARFLANLPPIQNKIRNTLSEIEINYRDRSLAREPEELGSVWRFHKGVKAGERAPDAVVFVEGKERRLATILRGCHFHLLLFGSDDQESWPTLERVAELVGSRFRAVLKIHFVGIDPEPPESIEQNYLFDHEEELHHVYAAIEPCAYIIRPDGYVACRSKLVDQRDLLKYLETWCVPVDD
jgi:2-polyprenyl-6-methoxyphenol hydroxylase-like FAD-dependent oxidoreductase